MSNCRAHVNMRGDKEAARPRPRAVENDSTLHQRIRTRTALEHIAVLLVVVELHVGRAQAGLQFRHDALGLGIGCKCALKSKKMGR